MSTASKLLVVGLLAVGAYLVYGYFSSRASTPAQAMVGPDGQQQQLIDTEGAPVMITMDDVYNAAENGQIIDAYSMYVEGTPIQMDPVSVAQDPVGAQYARIRIAPGVELSPLQMTAWGEDVVVGDWCSCAETFIPDSPITRTMATPSGSTSSVTPIVGYDEAGNPIEQYQVVISNEYVSGSVPVYSAIVNSREEANQLFNTFNVNRDLNSGTYSFQAETSGNVVNLSSLGNANVDVNAIGAWSASSVNQQSKAAGVSTTSDQTKVASTTTDFSDMEGYTPTDKITISGYGKDHDKVSGVITISDYYTGSQPSTGISLSNPADTTSTKNTLVSALKAKSGSVASGVKKSSTTSTPVTSHTSAQTDMISALMAKTEVFTSAAAKAAKQALETGVVSSKPVTKTTTTTPKKSSSGGGSVKRSSSTGSSSSSTRRRSASAYASQLSGGRVSW